MLPKQPNQSIIDGIRCLQAVVSMERAAGISEISRELHLETTRVHRLLGTLAHMGLLQRDKSRKYSPGPALPVLAAQTLRAIHLVGAPIQILDELYRETNMVVALGVRWQRHVSYLYHLEPGEPEQNGIANFRTWPAEYSGLGVVLLSRLTNQEVAALYEGHAIERFPLSELLDMVTQARENGYAYIFPTDGKRSLAVALNGNENMSLGIAGVIRPHEVARYLAILRKAAQDLEESLIANRNNIPGV